MASSTVSVGLVIAPSVSRIWILGASLNNRIYQLINRAFERGDGIAARYYYSAIQRNRAHFAAQPTPQSISSAAHTSQLAPAAPKPRGRKLPQRIGIRMGKQDMLELSSAQHVLEIKQRHRYRRVPMLAKRALVRILIQPRSEQYRHIRLRPHL
ncbi:hypothetical protein AYI69_g10025 [Smittium culicis]|uniref:Uncharacterized protein n=1 Tax=Smittium culicis TaxID=133412 RepID=A0A1R1X8R1_9FUNG|nr:hypothetical protein AYI69_g10025 [Smittium culicis]